MKQSEIWLVDLDPTKGAEIQKKRPAIIVNDDRLGKLPLKIRFYPQLCGYKFNPPLKNKIALLKFSNFL